MSISLFHLAARECVMRYKCAKTTHRRVSVLSRSHRRWTKKKLTCPPVEERLFFVPSPPEKEIKIHLRSRYGQSSKLQPIYSTFTLRPRKNHIRRLCGMQVDSGVPNCLLATVMIFINKRFDAHWYSTNCSDTFLCASAFYFSKMSNGFILHKIWFHCK